MLHYISKLSHYKDLAKPLSLHRITNPQGSLLVAMLNPLIS